MSLTLPSPIVSGSLYHGCFVGPQASHVPESLNDTEGGGGHRYEGGAKDPPTIHLGCLFGPSAILETTLTQQIDRGNPGGLMSPSETDG